MRRHAWRPGPIRQGSPSMDSAASPCGTQVSIHTSHTSGRRSPCGWRDVSSRYAPDDAAMTAAPASRPSRAISTGRPLMPEVENTTSVSRAPIGYRAAMSAARSARRSSALLFDRALMEHQLRRQHGGYGAQPARAVKPFLRQHVRMAAAEQVDQAVLRQRARDMRRGALHGLALGFPDGGQHADNLPVVSLHDIQAVSSLPGRREAKKPACASFSAAQPSCQYGAAQSYTSIAMSGSSMFSAVYHLAPVSMSETSSPLAAFTASSTPR